jgi:hypothetical protein
MKNGSPHRWFHALVVTGAAIAACGGSSDDSGKDAATDEPSSADAVGLDARSVDDASPDADGGNPIVITIDAGDVRNDPRCCIITA